MAIGQDEDSTLPYEITREKYGAYKRFWGTVTPREFLESVSKFHNDPFFEHVRYSINDLSEVEHFSLDDEHIDRTAAINIGSAYTNPHVKVIAVTTDPHIIGMARKYDQLHAQAPILICASLQEARDWIKSQAFGE